jgi:hypothetical protein
VPMVARSTTTMKQTTQLRQWIRDCQRLSQMVWLSLARKLQYFTLYQDTFHCAIRLFLASSTLFQGFCHVLCHSRLGTTACC